MLIIIRKVYESVNKFHKAGAKVSPFLFELFGVAQASRLSFRASRPKPSCDGRLLCAWIMTGFPMTHEEIRRDAEFNPRDAGATHRFRSEPFCEFPGRSRRSRPEPLSRPVGFDPKKNSSRARQSAPPGPSGTHTRRC